MPFDSRAAKALPSGKHLLIDECPGLRLVARATRKTWVFRYQNDQGLMKQKKLGAWPSIDYATAVSEWTKLRTQRDSGVDPVRADKEQRLAEELAAAQPQIETVQQLVNTFLNGYIKVERGAESATAAVNMMARVMEKEPVFAQTPPHQVTRRLAFDVIDRQKKYPAMAAKVRGLLAQAWDYGRDAGLIDDQIANHWREVFKGRLTSQGKIINGIHQGKVHRVLTDAELTILLPWCLQHMNPNGRDGMVMYLWTGMRGVEIFGLRPEYIGQERDGWWITYPVGLLKTEAHADTVDHRVPLVGRALEIVRRRMQRVGDSGYLFENSPRGVPQQFTQSAFGSYTYARQPESEKAKRRTAPAEGMLAPVSNWSPHDLRRTARTMLTRLRCDRQIAEAFIGHKPPGIVGIYDRHTFDQEKREWAPKLADAMEALLQAGLPARP